MRTSSLFTDVQYLVRNFEQIWMYLGIVLILYFDLVPLATKYD